LQSNLKKATDWAKTQKSSKDLEFFRTRIIPGTAKQLEMVAERYQKTGIFTVPPIYRSIVKGLNGKLTADQLLRVQLESQKGIVIEQPVWEPPPDKPVRPEIMRLLSINPTANTVLRYGIDRLEGEGGVMQSASQQGALSDPNDPNSPRIGEFVGGDNMNVSYLGQGGPDPDARLDIFKVPRGLGYVVENAAMKYGIPPHILAGLIEQESGWDPNAYNPSGATGIAQIIPKWHPEANPGVNAADDIMYAAKYLRQMMTDYGFDLETAIYAYNAGPNAVLKYGKGASPENRDYYPGVMEKSKKYRRKSYGPVRPQYEQLVQDSPYNSPDLLSPLLRDRVYTMT